MREEANKQTGPCSRNFQQKKRLIPLHTLYKQNPRNVIFTVKGRHIHAEAIHKQLSQKQIQKLMHAGILLMSLRVMLLFKLESSVHTPG